jgi:hypothetical protein
MFISIVRKTWINVSYFGLFVFKILNIVESQIEMKKIFSLAKIVIILRRCQLQTNCFLKVDICEQKLFKVVVNICLI